MCAKASLRHRPSHRFSADSSVRSAGELEALILQKITDHNGKPHFWQQGDGYDRNIFNDEELLEKVNYIHANPVRRGLVEFATEYRWSSAMFFEDDDRDDGPTIKRWH